MHTLVALGKLPQRSAQTAKFLKQVNDVFDFLNVQGFKKGKSPLRGDASDLAKIANFKVQAQRWVTKEKRQRQPCFLALVQCLNAIQMMSNDLVQNGIFSFLLSGRVNQDCLENLFSQVRAKGGHRFNPSAKEFVYAYRALVTNMLMTSIPSANCASDGVMLITSLSNMSSAVGKAKRKLQPEDVDDTTVNPSKRQRTDIAQVTSTAAETFVNDHISDFELTCTVKNVVSYVGGYIVRKLKLNDSCSGCLALLTDKSSSVTEENCSFISKFIDTMTILPLVLYMYHHLQTNLS